MKPALVLVARALPGPCSGCAAPSGAGQGGLSPREAAQGAEPGAELLPGAAPSSLPCAAATLGPPHSQPGSWNWVFFQVQTDSELFYKEILPVQHLEKKCVFLVF